MGSEMCIRDRYCISLYIRPETFVTPLVYGLIVNKQRYHVYELLDYDMPLITKTKCTVQRQHIQNQSPVSSNCRMYSRPSATVTVSRSSVTKLNQSVATDTIASSISTTSIRTWLHVTQVQTFNNSLQLNYKSVYLGKCMTHPTHIHYLKSM